MSGPMIVNDDGNSPLENKYIKFITHPILNDQFIDQRLRR